MPDELKIGSVVFGQPAAAYNPSRPLEGVALGGEAAMWAAGQMKRDLDAALAALQSERDRADAAERDARNWRELMPLLLRELGEDDDALRRAGNAPGHGHSRAGIWDDDNGELAGKPCAWCATWNAALSQQGENHG